MSFSGVPRGFCSVRQPPRLVTGSDPAVRRTCGCISRLTSRDLKSERPKGSVLREWRVTALGRVGGLSLGSDKFSAKAVPHLVDPMGQVIVGDPTLSFRLSSMFGFITLEVRSRSVATPYLPSHAGLAFRSISSIVSGMLPLSHSMSVGKHYAFGALAIQIEIVDGEEMRWNDDLARQLLLKLPDSQFPVGNWLSWFWPEVVVIQP